MAKAVFFWLIRGVACMALEVVLVCAEVELEGLCISGRNWGVAVGVAFCWLALAGVMLHPWGWEGWSSSAYPGVAMMITA